MKQIKYLGLLILLLVFNISCFDVATKVNNKGLEKDLLYHAKFGNLIGVKECIENGADINARGSYGTPLMVASYYGHLEVVKYLVSKKADINLEYDIKGSALRRATIGGHLEIVKHLVENGADMDFNHSNVGTVLNAASESGHIEIVEYLVAKGASLDAPLIRAAGVRDIELVRYLVERNANIDYQDSSKYTALIWAALTGELEIVQYLVDNKADANIRTNYGGTALWWGSSGGYLEIVKCLVEKCNADISLKDSSGETALDIAIRHERTLVVEYLESLGTKG